MTKAVKKQFAETRSVTQKLENIRVKEKTTRLLSSDRELARNDYPSRNLGIAFQYLSAMNY